MTQEPPVCDCPSYTALEGRNVVLRAELERLKHDLHHYDALQTAFHNVNKLVEEQEAEIERLTNAIRRIDGINDYPANYSPAINAICDAILRPHLEPKPFIAADDEKRVDELLTRAKKFGKMTLGDVEKLIERQEAEIERLKAENAALRAKPCSRCGLWPEPKDPCADMACPAGTKP